LRARVRGVVTAITTHREDLQEILVCIGEETRPAINYPRLTGPVQVGQSVVLNTWAMELKLGTGGADFVLETGWDEVQEEPPGHIMKLRYTPMQIPILAAEAPESPHHEVLRAFQSLHAVPVVCAELHSQLPAVAAAAKWAAKKEIRIAYIMTDSAALPMAYSQLVPQLRERGLLDATITCGQAFGGDYEAVNLYSALAVASAVAQADIIIVSQGPGGTGTATSLGFSGIDQGIALNAAATLGGTPIAVVRLSMADPRPRHLGISHHTRTVLERIALCPVLVPVPQQPGHRRNYWRRVLEDDLLERHEFLLVNAEEGLQALVNTGISVTTMGRSVQEERAFFLAAAAAGQVAGQWVLGTLNRSAPL
jgi:hypothetical protein